MNFQAAPAFQPSPPGYAPQVGPRHAEPSAMRPPAAAPLNLPSSTAPVTPAEFQQAQELLKNPQIQAQYAQLQGFGQPGMTPPAAMDNAALLNPAAIPPNSPNPPLPPLSSSQLGWVGLTSLLGIPFGVAIDRFAHGVHTPNSRLVKLLKSVDRLVPTRLGQFLGSRIQVDATALQQGRLANESAWLRLDGHYSGPQIRQQFFNAYLGRNGHLSRNIRALNLPPSLLQSLQVAKSTADIKRLLESRLKANPKDAKTKRLKALLSGFLKRANHIEKYQIPAENLKHGFHTAMRQRGIGPVGRLVGKVFFFLQNMTGGGQVPSLARVLTTRLLVGFGLFGLPLMTYFQAPKESKVAQLSENLATALGGYLGFEAGRHLVQEAGLLTRISGLAKFGLKRFLFLPVTTAGFLAEFLLPALLVGSIVTSAARSLSHIIFGDPQELELKAQYEADKATSLKTRHGLLEQLRNGQIPMIPGITPGVGVFTPGDITLTPENTGLTPQQIAQNPWRDTESLQALEELNHLTDFRKLIWHG